MEKRKWKITLYGIETEDNRYSVSRDWLLRPLKNDVVAHVAYGKAWTEPKDFIDIYATYLVANGVKGIWVYYDYPRTYNDAKATPDKERFTYWLEPDDPESIAELLDIAGSHYAILEKEADLYLAEHPNLNIKIKL